MDNWLPKTLFFLMIGLFIAVVTWSSLRSIEHGSAACWHNAAKAAVPHEQMIATCLGESK